MKELNHKTVFVLDHTPYFGISGDFPIDLEFVKNRSLASSSAPIPTISKSLWTCSVESSIEYCRIVWDLFPCGKLVRFVVSDQAAHIVNTWNPATQNLAHVMNAMSMVGVPPRAPVQSTDFSVIHGLRAAIEALAEPTDSQKEFSEKNKSDANVGNKGRVICITSARDDASMKSLEEIFHTVILQQNTLCVANPNLTPIENCHLVIINLFPATMDSLVTNRAVQEISPHLTSEIHSVRATTLSNKLTRLIMPHYDLASTTVTGIPMKEEQNASSSANYDVEIFHGSRAHSILLSTELMLPRSLKEGVDYETVTLKWCTPRGVGASDMQPCLGMHRVTPVDVTSRPSSCLINFLLNGRSVLLEMPRKSGGKITSHLLSAHGGEIFIHTLNVARSCLEDPPSISEGVGGKVWDYRITDFGALMQINRLVPLKAIQERKQDEHLLKMRTRIGKYSRYFPLTLGSTVLYNVRQFVEPILALINKEDLTDEEVVQCQQCIYHIVSLEARHEPLNLPNMGHRLKSVKKDEQYRLLWSELEILISNTGKSPGHNAILSCIRECRARGPNQTADKVELDQAIRELDPSSSSSEAIAAAHRASVIRTATDSPMSPPHADTSSTSKKKFFQSGNKSLFDIIQSMERTNSQKRLDFSGRFLTPSGQIAKLYPNLGAKEAALAARETGDVK